MDQNKSNTGIKHDQGKLEHHLLSPEAIKGLIQILQFGKTKYGAFNWAKGLKYSRVYDALLRHLQDDWWAGEDLDSETGLNHMYHVLCNAMFLAHYVSHPKKYAEFDDRPIKTICLHQHTVGGYSDRADGGTTYTLSCQDCGLALETKIIKPSTSINIDLDRANGIIQR